MKQSLKYGLLLVLALLIHSVANRTMENNCKEDPLTFRQEICRVSLNNPIHHAFEHLYYCLSIQASDLNHMDIASVPADKSILLFLSYFYEPLNSLNPPYSDSSPIPKYLSDPITHYIYGLRKIVI